MDHEFRRDFSSSEVRRPPIGGSGLATSAHGREGRVMANWPTPHLSPGSVTENCYLAMAAMRPDPSRPRDGSGLATTKWALDHDQDDPIRGRDAQISRPKNDRCLGTAE